MKHTLRKTWPLFAVAAALDAVIAFLYLSMWAADGPLTFLSWNGVVVLLGKLALSSAACSIAAGLWSATDAKRWPLVIHGVALGALGTIQYGLTGFSIGILTIAILVVVMALSLAAFDLDHGLSTAGMALLGFAAVFLALGFRWIGLGLGNHLDLLCLGAYFGFSAIYFFVVALRSAQSGIALVPAR